jgi:hypothetical protein
LRVVLDFERVVNRASAFSAKTDRFLSPHEVDKLHETGNSEILKSEQIEVAQPTRAQANPAAHPRNLSETRSDEW